MNKEFSDTVVAEEITEENVNLSRLSEYIHAAVGEASTLFNRNDEKIFDEQAALKLAERLITGVTKIAKDESEKAVGEAVDTLELWILNDQRTIENGNNEAYQAVKSVNIRKEFKKFRAELAGEGENE